MVMCARSGWCRLTSCPSVGAVARLQDDGGQECRHQGSEEDPGLGDVELFGRVVEGEVGDEQADTVKPTPETRLRPTMSNQFKEGSSSALVNRAVR